MDYPSQRQRIYESVQCYEDYCNDYAVASPQKSRRKNRQKSRQLATKSDDLICYSCQELPGNSNEQQSLKKLVFHSCFLENSENFLNFAKSSKKFGECLNFLGFPNIFSDFQVFFYIFKLAF